jgi:hypothetical protein
MGIGYARCFPDLAVFQFPGALSAAESFCPNIDRICTTGKYCLYHFDTAARSQQFVHGIESSLLIDWHLSVPENQDPDKRDLRKKSHNISINNRLRNKTFNFKAFMHLLSRDFWVHPGSYTCPAFIMMLLP